MTFAKQTLTLIFFSAHIILATSADAYSAPSPTMVEGLDQTEVEEEPNHPSKFPLPEVTVTTPEVTVGSQADVVNVVAKQMQAIEKKINEFNASLKKRMDNPLASHGTKECVAECDEVFTAAVDDIKNTLDSLESRNFFKATFDISAVSTNVDTCNDCFNEMVGGDLEVKKLSEWVRSINGEALEALETATG